MPLGTRAQGSADRLPDLNPWPLSSAGVGLPVTSNLTICTGEGDGRRQRRGGRGRGAGVGRLLPRPRGWRGISTGWRVRRRGRRAARVLSLEIVLAIIPCTHGHKPAAAGRLLARAARVRASDPVLAGFICTHGHKTAAAGRLLTIRRTAVATSTRAEAIVALAVRRRTAVTMGACAKALVAEKQLRRRRNCNVVLLFRWVARRRQVWRHAIAVGIVARYKECQASEGGESDDRARVSGRCPFAALHRDGSR